MNTLTRSAVEDSNDAGQASKSAEWCLKALRDMVAIRKFEQAVQKQIDAGNVRGTTHVCIGQEAVAVGACDMLQKGDMVTSTHRGHGHFLAAGGDMNRVMAELFGRQDGYCHGKGGTQHMASVEVGFVGSNGITGGGIPYATGMALAMKMRKKSNVVLSFFGDGAANQGTFHESLNMASIWHLPIVYLIENNQYAMGTSVRASIKIDRLVDRAPAYGMKGIHVDGNDVIAVSDALHEAAAYARSGDGPVLVEAKTYRMAGHSRNDRCVYRTREEEQAWGQLCPLLRLKNYLSENGYCNEGDYAELEETVDQEVQQAIAFAGQSAYIEERQLYEGVFC